MRALGTAGFGWPEHGVVGEFDGVVRYGRVLRAGHRMRAVLEGVVRWVWAELDAFADVAQRLPR